MMGSAYAETAAPQKIPMAVACWQVSKEGKRVPTFADKFSLNFLNGTLTGVRPTRVKKGSESYKGSVDPEGKIKVSGRGHFDDRTYEWTSEYAGQLQEKGPTNLQGTLRFSGSAPAVHKCAIAFLLPPADLAKILSVKEVAAQPKPQ
jgi:hypothetical protein